MRWPAPRRSEVAALAIGGLDALDDYFGKYLPQLVLAVVVPVIVVVQLGLVDATAAVTVVLTLPLIPVFMALVGRTTEASNRSRWRALSRLSHHFLDVIEGMPTLRSFGRGAAQVQQVRISTDRYRSTTMATLRIAFLSSLVLELLATLSVALVAVGVGLRLVDGGLDLRTGLFVIVLAPEAYLPLRQVGAHYHASVQASRPQTRRSPSSRRRSRSSAGRPVRRRTAARSRSRSTACPSTTSVAIGRLRMAPR